MSLLDDGIAFLQDIKTALESISAMNLRTIQLVNQQEQMMTEQQTQYDTLKSDLDQIVTNDTAISARLTALLSQISTLNSQPSLQPLIDEAASIVQTSGAMANPPATTS